MAKKTFKQGKRISVWIPPAQRGTQEEIANFSRFVQLCIDNAPDIMAWAILRKVNPKKYHPLHKKEDVIEEFNEKYPLDPLTAKRTGKKWPQNSPKLPDVLL